MMQPLTYEFRDSEETADIFETYEWDNAWIEYANGRSDVNRVLYIGDSISQITRQVATAQSGETILFDGFATSKAVDNPYFKEALSCFAKQLPGTELVLFNNGLHGYHLEDSKQYGFYYEEMVKFLLDEFAGLPLFIVLTTRVVDEEETKRIVKRNEAVLAIAEKYKLPVIDLYSVSEANLHLISEDGTHFTQAGYEAVAKAIIEAISSALPEKKSK